MSTHPFIYKLPSGVVWDHLLFLLAQNQTAFILDSSSRHAASRFSYAGSGALSVLCGSDDPWTKLESCFPLQSSSSNQHPFCGGYVGYLSFENYASLLPGQWKPKKSCYPGYWFGMFDPVFIKDHQSGSLFLASFCQPEVQKIWLEYEKALSEIPSKRSAGLGKILVEPSYDEYAPKIQAIKNYLREGDAYQINYTCSFKASYEGSAFQLYQALRKISPVPYGAYLQCGDFQIISASPELFVDYDGHIIVTKPIKGTKPRMLDRALDEEQKQKLVTSEKDRAELLMITDLERNDLGQVCQFGSVKADPLFGLESFEQVHHLVSTVKGIPKKGISPLDILKALFPGGSVTGTPKIRALQIIEELEENSRGIYTGALGYVGKNGQMMMNLPIRTLVKKGSEVFFHAGGGIVIDSDPMAEYEEMMIKIEGIRKAITHEDTH